MTNLFQDNKTSEQNKQSTSLKIREWIVTNMADLLEIEPEEIDVETTFARYGLDSSGAMVLTGDLGDWLGIQLDATLVYDYPTIAALADYVAEASQEKL